MKKQLIFYILLCLSILSLFLPATLKPNPETFQLDKVNFFAIIYARIPSVILICLAIILVLFTYLKVKQHLTLAIGILIGTYLQFIITYINWTYLGNHFFNIYLYGFWFQLIFTGAIFIWLLNYNKSSRK